MMFKRSQVSGFSFWLIAACIAVFLMLAPLRMYFFTCSQIDSPGLVAAAEDSKDGGEGDDDDTTRFA